MAGHRAQTHIPSCAGHKGCWLGVGRICRDQEVSWERGRRPLAPSCRDGHCDILLMGTQDPQTPCQQPGPQIWPADLCSGCHGAVSMHQKKGSISRICLHGRHQGLLLGYFILFFIFWSHHAACGILVPRPGIEPASPALEAQSLNQWTTREDP